MWWVLSCAGVPNYLEVITDPMDLGTVKKSMASKRYETHEQWADDIRKVWNNAMYFNAAGKRPYLRPAMEIWMGKVVFGVMRVVTNGEL